MWSSSGNTSGNRLTRTLSADEKFGGLIDRNHPIQRVFSSGSKLCVVIFYTIMCVNLPYRGVLPCTLNKLEKPFPFPSTSALRQGSAISSTKQPIDWDRSRSDFMLEAACREAQDVLLDQTFFTVDAGTFTQFQALLDKPLPPTDKLRRLLKTKAPWEQ